MAICRTVVDEFTRIWAAEPQCEAESSIERHGANHVPDGECDGANLLDGHPASLAGVGAAGKAPVGGPHQHVAVQAKTALPKPLDQRYGIATPGHRC